MQLFALSKRATTLTVVFLSAMDKMVKMLYTKVAIFEKGKLNSSYAPTIKFLI